MTNDAHGGRPNGTGVMCPVATVDVKTRRRSGSSRTSRPASRSGAAGLADPGPRGAHLAGRDGRRIHLGRDDRAVDRWCGAGTECGHDRTHRADGEVASDDSAVSITDLTRVGKKVAIIPSLELIVTPSVIDKVDRAYVTVQAENIKFPSDLHEGSIVAGTVGNQAPALFCVSHPEIAGN